jgi:predicted nucleic acid-binding Zn ribbon protein
LQKISHILSSIIQDLGLQKKLDECKALTIWADVVGEQISKVTVPQRFSGGRLFVRVISDSWRTELIFHKQDIIRKLNENLGSHTVDEIVLI